MNLTSRIFLFLVALIFLSGSSAQAKPKGSFLEDFVYNYQNSGKALFVISTGKKTETFYLKDSTVDFLIHHYPRFAEWLDGFEDNFSSETDSGTILLISRYGTTH